MAEQQLIGALEAGGTKMVCATGYADGTVLEREQIATTTPQETVEAVNAWFADKGIAALGIGAIDQVLQPFLGAVLGKIIVLVAIILFLQWKPGGLFPTRNRSLD